MHIWQKQRISLPESDRTRTSVDFWPIIALTSAAGPGVTAQRTLVWDRTRAYLPAKPWRTGLTAGLKHHRRLAG